MNEVPQNEFIPRQMKLAAALQASGLDALVLNPGPTLVYLTGLHFHLMERPIVVIFTPQHPPVIILPELEIPKTTALPYIVRSFTYGEDPAKWIYTFQAAFQSIHLTRAQVGVEDTRLRLLELRLLEAAVPQVNFISAAAVLATLRMYKEPGEIAAMRKAVDIAQRALTATLPAIKIGTTERAIASELTLQLLRAGSDSEIPFAPIVSGGPNGANPHAVPSDRPLQAGDLLVIDWGAAFNGYFSDLTRTFAVGPVEPEFTRIHQLVLEANTAGRAAAGPEITAQEVDRATRAVIENAGYGQYFTHRTGHGLGMEGHEEPYIREGNRAPLLPGNTFTIEPGIYLPNRGGVRIEDDIVITIHGAESLSDFPRELIVL